MATTARRRASTRASVPDPGPADGGLERTGHVVVSRDKAFGRVVGTVPATHPADVQAVVDRAAAAWPAWAATPLEARLTRLRRVRELVLERIEELARLSSLETGKTIVEAVPMELAVVVDTCAWLEGHAERHLRTVDPGTPQRILLLGRRHSIQLDPYGVLAVIAPWNYPLSVASGPILFGLAAGNAIVYKPSSHTPLLGQAFRDLLVDAGLPPDLVGIVHGGAAVGEALVSARRVEKVFFTGSEPAGRRVMALAAAASDFPKPVVLELGGKDAMLVLRDADLDRAAAGAAWAGFGHAGQTCGSIKRVYVDRAIAADFEARLGARARALVPGDPLVPSTQLGAVANAESRDIVVALVRDALDRGARLVAGGPDPVRLPGAAPDAVGHLPATILADVPPAARLWHEELFGPVMVLHAFDTEEEAIRLADGSRFGLSASVWSRDEARARRLAERLDVGSVLVNDHLSTYAISQVGWTGRRASGFGVSRSRFGLWEVTRPKSIGTAPGWYRPPWWHPYDRHLGEGFATVLRALYGSTTGPRADAVRANGPGVRRVLRRVATSLVPPDRPGGRGRRP
jgi:succinate-semialdehyde dehydrogenase/glutarate-semialdehyde dehydrogenase